MNKKLLLTLLLSIFIFASCKDSKKDNMNEENPLLSEFTNQYGIPPFDKIKTEHFMPAFQKAMEEQNKIIQSIVDNKEAPTFQNTIEAYEYSGLLLSRVNGVFYNYLSAISNDTLQQLAQDLVPLQTKHWADIQFNEKLFNKIKAVYDAKDKLNLNPEQLKLLEETYKDFVRAGAGLPKDKQDRLRKINEDLASLSLQFDNNILAEVNNFKLVVDKKEDLAGLPQGMIDEAAELAKADSMPGKWVFTIHRPVIIPFLQYCDNRDLREKMFKAYINKGNNNNQYDNKEIINKIVNLRVEKAQIFGYKNYAEYVLTQNMSKTPEKVYEFLNSLFEKALPIAQKEAKDLQAMIAKDGKKFKLEPWDWWYYTEKIRQSKYELSEEQIKEYFPLDSVMKGLLNVVKKLYGLDIQKLNDAPLYHPDAVAYLVKESNGNLVGVVYMDFFTRDTKQGGAWMNGFVEQYKLDGKDHRPVISTCFNYTKPSGDKPVLLTLEEVSTIFHEFGHALHGLLSNCTYPSIGGTSVARDFVELPSQILENWALEPSVIKTYAKHYKTGEPIPDELLAKIDNASKFNQGFETIEYLSASLLDMDYHTISEQQDMNILDFEANSMKKMNMPQEIVVRYRSTYFSHIFAGEYFAGYYSYIWAAVLDADAYEAFKETGDVFNQTVAKSFRDNILSRGGTDEPMKLYVKFRGREPQIEPLLKKRGLM